MNRHRLPDLTAERLRKLLSYDPETGVWTWRKTGKGRNASLVAGNVRNKRYAYVSIVIDTRRYLAHRLAWLYTNGQWPKSQVDHIDLDPSNNRLSNLREATHSQNRANSKARAACGLKGVGSQRRTWRAVITADRIQTHLAIFDCPAAAHFAYIVAAHETFGEFAR